jgi:hypothetical protein
VSTIFTIVVDDMEFTFEHKLVSIQTCSKLAIWGDAILLCSSRTGGQTWLGTSDQRRR